MTETLRLRLERKRELVRRHLEVLKEALKTLKEKLGEFSEETIERARAGGEILPYLDQVAYRFAKLQEDFGDLLRLFMVFKGEEAERLPVLDLVNLSEKRGLSVSAETWLKWRRLRNVLIHEYPEEEEEIAQALKEIEREIPKLEGLLKEIEDGVQAF